MDLKALFNRILPVLIALAIWEMFVRGLLMKNTYDDSSRLEGKDHFEK